jgi:AGCS family alanine or glycine:cation symporter
MNAEALNHFINNLNNVLFSNYTVYALVITGLIFTVWSVVGQYKALTHGVAVIRGKYDDKNDPGAINHFQALSAALSATVGLGNIGGVAVAVALGGPGAIMWMWVIGFVGMALKMTEVTQSMLHRDTSDPANPHGGPMFVISHGLAEKPHLRVVAGLVFAVVTSGLSILAYQAFGSWLALVPGGLLAAVFLVMGLMKGTALGPLIGGVFVVTLLISAITGGNMFQAWNVADVTFTYFQVPQIATGIVLAVIVGLVIIGGIKRIGAVAGRIVPLMCVIYVAAAGYVLIVNFAKIPDMFALIIKSGLPTWLGGESASPSGAFLGGTFGYAALWGIKRALFSSEAGQGSSPIAHSAAKTDEPVREGVVAGLEPFIDTIVVCTLTALVIFSSGAYNRESEALFAAPDEVRVVAADADGNGQQDTNNTGVPLWTIDSDYLPDRTAEAKRIHSLPLDSEGWREGEIVFMIVHADPNADTGRDLRRITGTVNQREDGSWGVTWNTLASTKEPAFTAVGIEGDDPDYGVYGDYAGASMTAHAFDRVRPGLGKWLIVFASWLFAVSTMISWSYYGEQGVYFLLRRAGERVASKAVLIYKLIYCGLIVVTTLGFIRTDEQLDMWTTLGLGVMLVANIPIMLIFGSKAMGAYKDYFRRMDAGDDAHEPPKFSDVVEGKDVQ